MGKLLETFLYRVGWKQDPIVHFPMVGAGVGKPVGMPESITNYAQPEGLSKSADVRMTRIVRAGLPANAFHVVGSEHIDTQKDITRIQPCWVS